MQQGLNVIGYLGASSGLGNTARLFIEVLRGQGVDVAGFDIDYPLQRGEKVEAGISKVKDIEELPHELNLIVVAIANLPKLWRDYPELVSGRYRNVALVFWELPTIPSAWQPSLAILDAILVCSPYVRQAVEIAVPEVPTLLVEHPIARMGRPHGDVSARYGIDRHKFVCLASFDLRSDLSRKNPHAVILAFQRAFKTESDVQLVIKTNSRQADGAATVGVQDLMQMIEADARIRLISDTLDYGQVLDLYASCDVFVSLHRAEGLGLGPLEAMSLGKPVVATGYSGNMAYMSPFNSMLVDYELIEPYQCNWQYGREFAGANAAWADADVEQASQALLRLRGDRDLCRTLGQRAKMEIQERQEIAWAGEFLPKLQNILGRQVAKKNRKAIRAKVLLNEIKNPTFRKKNISSLMQRLKRVFS